MTNMNIKINKLHCFLLLLLFIFSCKGSSEKDNNREKIDRLINISSYKIKKKVINDTIIKIEGKNDNYYITGYLNSKRKKRDNWWKITSINNQKKILDIEYILIGNEEIKNQIIFYKNNKIDSLSSKFYKIKPKELGYLVSIYLPQSKFKTTSAKFKYNIIKKKNGVKSYIVNCIKKENKYSCIVDASEYGNEISIKGIFRQFSELKNKDSVILESNMMFIEVR